MATTTFVDTVPGPAGSGGTPGTPFVASWFNDIDAAVYAAIGDGVTAPTTAANVITNLGVPTLAAATNAFTGNMTIGGTLAVSGTLAVTGHVTVEGITSTGATGTGKFVFDAAPTISGHPTIEGVTSTGATGTGKFVFDTSPTLGGTPLAPTAAADTNSTQIATTAFVQSTNSALIGSSRSAKMVITTAAATGTFTADELVVKVALGGLSKVLGSYSQAINLATTGAGGMDTGTAPVSGFVSLYAIYGTSGTSILACAVGTSSGEIYSGVNMPAGYTYSALLGIWPTDGSSLFIAGMIRDRTFSFKSFSSVLTANADISPMTSQALTNIPTIAKRVSLVASNTTATTNQKIVAAADATGTGIRMVVNSAGPGSTITIGGTTRYTYALVHDVEIITAQTIYIILVSATATNYLDVINYSW